MNFILKPIFIYILFLGVILAPFSVVIPPIVHAATSIPAFPGAEGWGAESIGGRGGRVIEVINLNNSGEGSLRDCAEASGKRICVFRVAGIIDLQSSISIRNPFITIAGQTAPGDGITIRGGGIAIKTNNVIVRYLHWRGGSNSFVSGRAANDAHDIIIDHCSAAGGEDDIIDFYYNVDGAPDMRRVTVQRCIIAEANAVHPTASVFGGSQDPSTGKDWNKRNHHNSYHHNYLVHNSHRNPLIKSWYTELINNVVYNWKAAIGTTGDNSESDWINNYAKPGPMDKGRNNHFEFIQGGVEFPLSSIYVAGSIIEGRFDDPAADNWPQWREHRGPGGREDIPSEANRRFTPLAPAPIPVTIEPALSFVDSLLLDVGANRRLNADGSFTNVLDSADQQFIDDYYAGTGPTSPPTSATMPSSIDPGTPYADLDKDGMADQWENTHFGNLTTAGTALASISDFDKDGYTDLEEFLNGTDPRVAGGLPPSPTPTPTPTPLPPGPPPPPPPPLAPPAVCGDGTIDTGEECDGNNLDGRSTQCSDNGYKEGIFSCYPAGHPQECRYDVSDCAGLGLVPCGQLGNPCGFCHVFQLLKNILDVFLFPIVPTVAGLLFATGGFFFLTSAGSGPRLERAKQIITATVVGLLIVYGAWLFINMLFGFLGVITFTGLGTWWEITC